MASATHESRAGDHVRWNSEAGHVTGRIVAVHTHDTEFMGRTRHCSEQRPQYEIEIESDKIDHLAMHYGSALQKVK